MLKRDCEDVHGKTSLSFVSFDYYDRRLCFVSLVVQVEYSNPTLNIYIFVPVSTIEEINQNLNF